MLISDVSFRFLAREKVNLFVDHHAAQGDQFASVTESATIEGGDTKTSSC
jgi:hypothetical protein